MLIYLQKKDTSFYSELDYEAVTFEIPIFWKKNTFIRGEDDEWKEGFLHNEDFQSRGSKWWAFGKYFSHMATTFFSASSMCFIHFRMNIFVSWKQRSAARQIDIYSQ